jgi:hypothetical protein
METLDGDKYRRKERRGVLTHQHHDVLQGRDPPPHFNQEVL